jgi:dienelactone hydrolase
MQSVFAQKPVIDATSYTRWPSLGGGEISNDGRYMFYNVKDARQSKTIIKQVVESKENSWQLEVQGPGKNTPKFTSDSKHCIFNNSEDSIGIITLGISSVKYIANVTTWRVPNYGSGEWLCYQMVKDEKTLFFLNFKTGKERVFHDVLSYQWSENGKILVLRTKSLESENKEALFWVDMNTGIMTIIWGNTEFKSLLLDSRNTQIAIKKDHSLWLYKFGMSTPMFLIDENSPEIGDTLKLGSIHHFSNDGNYLFVNLESKIIHEPITKKGLEIWSYLDKKIQSIQVNKIDRSYATSYIAVINLTDRKFTRIQKYKDENFSFPEHKKGLNDKELITHKIDAGDLDEIGWNRTTRYRYDLVSTTTGNRKQLTWLTKMLDVNLSICGRFITYYDKENNFFSYEINSGSIRNLTEGLRISWRDVIHPEYKINRGVAGWLENDESVLVYDSYDIWKLDPLGQSPPVNLTNGYGVKHNVIFTFGLEKYLNQPISKATGLILNAFSLENMNNGFFRASITKKEDPELLTMGPYAYHLLLSNNNLSMQQRGDYPVKARNADIYLVKRTSANESSNYFSTNDFKTFTPISNLSPEKFYNWYSTELHTYKSPEGRKLQGILYKPENFDPNKKYPVIFYYYEKMTGALNVCLKPEYSQGSLDISTYVSNGYLIFCPDIYYTIGDPMQGTYNSIVSSAKYLIKLPFVDSTKMGIQGHSWGGVQTNFLVTRTNLFAAACSASGIADWISIYGGLSVDAENKWLGSFYETGQPRMGANLWEKRDIYIKNSAVLYADRVTTPLLMMHTKKDRICLYPNAREFFLGLRRLGKRAWMLVYPEGNHSLRGNESEDFTNRMMQFFDHYLKDKPAPIWMLEGTDAPNRGINSAFQLDSIGRTPGPGLLTLEEQSKQSENENVRCDYR